MTLRTLVRQAASKRARAREAVLQARRGQGKPRGDGQLGDSEGRRFAARGGREWARAAVQTLQAANAARSSAATDGGDSRDTEHATGRCEKQLTGAHWCLRQRPVSLVGRKGQLGLSKAWRGVPDARHGADQLARALGHGRSARGAYARGGRHVVAGRWCKGQERGSALGPRGEPLVSAQARLHVHRGRRARRRRNDLVAGGSGRPRSGCHAPRSPADGVGPSTEAAARGGRAGGESQQVRVLYLWQSRIGPQRLWRRTARARALLLRTPPRKPRQAGPVLAHLLAGCSCCHQRLPGPVGAGLTQSPVVQRAAH